MSDLDLGAIQDRCATTRLAWTERPDELALLAGDRHRGRRRLPAANTPRCAACSRLLWRQLPPQFATVIKLRRR